MTILKEIIGEYTGSCADFIRNILTNIEVNSTSLIIGELTVFIFKIGKEVKSADRRNVKLNFFNSFAIRKSHNLCPEDKISI